MSTILKALRRLEEEKAASEQRPLREEVAAFGASEPRRSRHWPALGVLLVALAAGAGLWSQWPGDGAESGLPADVAAQAVPPVLIDRQTPAPESRTPASPRRDRLAASGDRELPEEAFSSSVEVVKRPPATLRVPIELSRAAAPPEPEPPPARTQEPAPAPIQAAESAPKPVVAAKPATEKSAPKPVVAEKSAPKPAVAAKPVAEKSAPRPAVAAKPVAEPVVAAKLSPKPAAEESVAKPVVEAPAPTSETADLAVTKPTSPPPAPPEAAGTTATPSILRVEKTLWHPVAGRRVAVVAQDDGPSQRFHEGEVVGRYLVSEIQPSGVVFLLDGKPVRRKIGE